MPKIELPQAEINRRQIAAMWGHRPGRNITLPDGSTYHVTTSGSWMRITKRRLCENITIGNDLHNHAARRRQGV